MAADGTRDSCRPPTRILAGLRLRCFGQVCTAPLVGCGRRKSRGCGTACQCHIRVGCGPGAGTKGTGSKVLLPLAGWRAVKWRRMCALYVGPERRGQSRQQRKRMEQMNRSRGSGCGRASPTPRRSRTLRFCFCFCVCSGGVAPQEPQAWPHSAFGVVAGPPAFSVFAPQEPQAWPHSAFGVVAGPPAFSVFAPQEPQA